MDRVAHSCHFCNPSSIVTNETIGINSQPNCNGAQHTKSSNRNTIADKLKLTKILIAIAKIGIMTDLYPKASPNITLVAAPVRQESTTSCTGLQKQRRHWHYIEIITTNRAKREYENGMMGLTIEISK